MWSAILPLSYIIRQADLSNREGPLTSTTPSTHDLLGLPADPRVIDVMERRGPTVRSLPEVSRRRVMSENAVRRYRLPVPGA